MSLNFARPLVLILIPIFLAYAWWGLRGFPLPGRPVRRARRANSGRGRLVLALRWIMSLVLILALAGPQWRYVIDRQSVVFVTDLSASARGTKNTVEDFIRSALKGRSGQDTAGVVAFGEEALVELPLASQVEMEPLSSTPGPHWSNLASGLRLAGALVPESSRKRIVLFSDGRENLGDALAEAANLAARGIRIDVVSLKAERSQDVLIDNLSVPGRLFEGENFQVTVSLRSNINTTAILRLFADRSHMAEERVELTPGENRFAFKAKASGPGFHTYRATIEAEGDGLGENNQAAAISRVEGVPSVLLVQRTEEDGATLASALRAAGLKVETRPPALIPPTLDELRSFSSVVLINVPAMDVADKTMAAMESYVRDLGGGLVMIGGEESFGLGGYFKTPIEKALPVYMDLRGKAEIPTVGLVLVIDKSGSMGGGAYGTSKMELAKEAAIRATEIMSARDQIGVVGFDHAAGWVSPLALLTDPKKVQDDIGTLRPDGGTNIYPGVEMAYQALLNVDTKIKHIILLTDGMSAEGGDYLALSEEMKKNKITMSAVAVGADSDTGLLEKLAKWGNGRYYFTDDVESIPKIFAKETILATRTYIVEKDFTPGVASPSPVLRGLDGVRDLMGYVATSPKEAAEVVLAAPNGDPVLAQWQYGLGRSIAWTSDVKGRWAGPWIGTPELAALWANIISWIQPPADPGDLLVETRFEGGTGIITAEVPGAVGSLPTRATIVDPDLGTREIELKATAPGQYEARFPARSPGAYLISLRQERPGKGQVQVGTGLVVPYSPEYRQMASGQPLLENLARQTGGEVITDPAQAFARNLAPVFGQVEMWPWLLALAAIIWPTDIAARRIFFTRADILGALAALRSRLGLRRGGLAESTATLAQLQRRKTGYVQARQAVTRTAGPIAASAGDAGTSASETHWDRPGAEVTGGRSGQAHPQSGSTAPRPVRSPGSGAQQAAPAQSDKPAEPQEAPAFTSRLLEAKKKAGRK